MARVPVFISFDFDNDEDLKNLLAGQAKNPDSPFEIQNWSLKEPLSGNWQAKIRDRIKRSRQVIVICGTHTDRASGVSVEIEIARSEGIPYFLVWGRKEAQSKKPRSARESDKIYKWTWDNLKSLISGAR